MKESTLPEGDMIESKVCRGVDRRTFVHADHTPPNALRWRARAERDKALWPWRKAVNRKFADRPSWLRVAWMLDELFGKEGYAFPTDSWFEREVGIARNKVQAALLGLERGNAIIRASAIVDDKAQRRIWPSALVIYPVTGCIHTPRNGGKVYPVKGTHTSYYQERSTKNGLSSTALAARRDANLREAKEQDRQWMRANGALAEGPAKPHPSLPSSPRGEDL